MYLDKVNPYSISKQHKREKLHIFERVKLLFDRDSFVEYYPLDENIAACGFDGVITGYGNICGQRVYFYGQDFTCMGGTFGYQHSQQIIAILKEAVKNRRPIIGIYDGGGARIQEGAASVAGCGELFKWNAIASGYIPQIAIIAGTCAGGAVYSPGLMDFIFTIDKISNMFVTGAKVINEVQGTDYLIEELGGAQIHSSISGVAHFRTKNERTCYEKVRKLIDLLPPCFSEERSFCVDRYYEKDLCDIVNILPQDPFEPYDVHKIIEEVLDDDSFLEIQEEFAKNIVIGLGTLGGYTVGIVANQTLYKNGSIDVDCSDKAARFVQFCDCFNIPIITFADATGFVMEAQQEQQGLIRHGAKMIQAYAGATTIRLTVILRKAYGGPYIFMGCKQLGADKHYVWPNAQVAVMKAEGAVAVISHSQLSRLEGPEKETFLKEQLEQYKQKYMNSDLVLSRHFVDEELNPMMTRRRLYQDIIHFSQVKGDFPVRKKHANTPV
ncbi:MAG: acyl-CoA carboxylase subunit beta [Lachnospiraceae bacterium]